MTKKNLKTYNVKVSVGDGRNEEEFVEFYSIATDKTPKDIWTAWDKCKEEYPDGWETSQLIESMRSIGFNMQLTQNETIELEA